MATQTEIPRPLTHLVWNWSRLKKLNLKYGKHFESGPKHMFKEKLGLKVVLLCGKAAPAFESEAWDEQLKRTRRWRNLGAIYIYIYIDIDIDIYI